MAIPLSGKIIIPLLVLAVTGAMVALIVIIVNDEDTATEAPLPSTTTTTTDATPPTVVTTPEGPIAKEAIYEIGVGIADMTGPCVEINFMGYAEIGQSGRGIHMRQYSRAFIFVQGNTRIVLVTAEVLAVGIAVRREVVKNLQELYGDMYSLRNVILTGTHTHSAPGGHLVDLLLDITILGFSRETYNAYVAGITRSIVRAHENIVPARLFFGQTVVQDVQINRSPYSYEYNPAEERQRYDSNTDNVLTQVRIEREDGRLHGVLNWFPLHTTSMNMSNQLVSSDNLGYAAMRLERELNSANLTREPVVAGFFSSNLGDVSPNTRGARCEFSGDPCDNHFTLCGALERCFASGPGRDMFESTKIIGAAVFEAALDVVKSRGAELRGELAVLHQFIDMPQEVVPKYDPVARRFDANDPVNGCMPALGYSFGSGTTDGANVFNISQGTLTGIPELDRLVGLIMNPTEEDIECHAPKPILLATGRANFTLQWHTQIVSATLIWLGGLGIAGVPGEPTTMAGRRIKDVVGEVMRSRGYDPNKVVVSGLTNEYIHYMSTFEEYQVQRYEAASTIYGPHTLDIYLNKFEELTAAAIDGTTVVPGPEPEDHRDNTFSLVPPVILDSTPMGRSFGDVLEGPPSSVRVGDLVAVTFVAANPRNDIRQESSHAVVERAEGDGWVTVATDADWETKFHWERVSTIFGTSRARVEWEVPAGTRSGAHRIVYRGAARSIIGFITQFTGISDTFQVNS